MNHIAIEIVGIVASIIILVSMLFKTTSLKGSIIMRSINILGAGIFVVYGCLLPAISSALLNGALVIVNIYHLALLIIQYKKSKQETK